MIAGQQPGLAMGPLYTVWKLLTAIMLAEESTKKHGIDAIPAFWIASEDHDILEVNRFNCRTSTFVADPGFPTVRGHLRPVGLVSLEKHRDPLLAFLQQELSREPWISWLIEHVAACDFSGYGRFFATFAAGLFCRNRSIVFIDALDAHRMTAPYLADAVERFEAVTGALVLGGNNLKAAGFQPPLEDCGLFEILPGDNPSRMKCTIEKGGIGHSGGVTSFAGMADLIRQYPERFSAGAAFRPVIQDAAFPVAVTVGGPSELQYLWQIDPIYDVMQIRRSRLYPRITATILPSSALRLIEKIGGIERALAVFSDQAPVNSSEPDPIRDADLSRLGLLSRELTGWISTLQGGDPDILGKAVSSIGHQVSKVSENIRRKRDEAAGVSLQRIRRFQDIILPGGRAQERVMNICEHLAEQGPDWIERMLESLDIRPGIHQFVIMSQERVEPMTVDVVAIGAHPDDIDLIAGGTIAKLVRLGQARCRNRSDER